MSSINPVFQPLTPMYAVDDSAAVQITEAGQVGATVFRIRAITASGYISWGPKSTVAAPTAPSAAGQKSPNTIGVTLGQAVYIEVPPNSYFIGSAAFGTGSFEVTGGQGGASSG